MDLMCTPEEEQISSVAAQFFSAAFPLERLRDPHRHGARWETKAWQEAIDMGLFAGGIPMSANGTGLTLAQMTLIFSACGKYLVDAAALTIDLAAQVAVEDGNAELAQRIGRGDVKVGLANNIQCDDLTSRAALYHLIDSEGAELVLVWTDQIGRLHRISDFKNVRQVRALDGSVTLARSELARDAEAVAVFEGPTLAIRARILISAILTGIAEATLEMAVDYAKLREQFDKTIGSFQAIKHFCADMATRTESARALVTFAALNVSNADAAFQAHSALIIAANAAELNALKNIQIHGGIGFTAECNAHLYLKRVHLLIRLQGGPPASRRSLISTSVPIAAEDG